MNKENRIEITFSPDQSKHQITSGQTLLELSELLVKNPEHPILGALVNNKLTSLHDTVSTPSQISFIDITHPQGRSVYTNGILFLMHVVIKRDFPEAKFRVRHSISNGVYCELTHVDSSTFDKVCTDLTAEIKKMIKAELPITKEYMENKKIVELFRRYNFQDKANYIEGKNKFYTPIYVFEKYICNSHEPFISNTKQLSSFSIKAFYNGILVRVPESNAPFSIPEATPQPKMFKVFKEHTAWGDIIGVDTVAQLNAHTQQKLSSEVIKLSEALQERKVVDIAQNIANQKERIRVILIAGPSSSGKTTLCKRLSIQLTIAGLKPVGISLDNYFVDRELTPRDENGEYDFECLEALDVELFNQNILDLMDGKSIHLPRFDFKDGKRFYEENETSITPQHILIVEGIHGLNPLLTSQIDASAKYGIFISALTQLSIDYHHYIHTTDNRLLRRIVRDFQYRNYSANETIKRWPSVRAGENKYIFPHQENADIMFNSALVYELGVLKKLATSILRAVHETDNEYAEAQRLLTLLSFVNTIPDKEVPPTSILREFLSWSSFSY